MTLLSFFRELYSLDTLDTRFNASSRSPPKIDDSEPRKPSKKDIQDSSDAAPSSRWGTAEFYLYALVFLVCVPQMYWAVWQVSQPDAPNHDKFEPLLSQGWMFGRKVDNSDSQYSGFRDNIPALAALVVIHPLMRRLYEQLAGSGSTSLANGAGKTDISIQQAEHRRDMRLRFDLASALVFITALYGVSAVKILVIVYINYRIATALPRNYVPAATWIFNVTILFANELTQGYPFAKLLSVVHPYTEHGPKYGQILDSYGGLMPRWEVLFKITILRLISFNMDYYWSLDRSRSGSPVEVSMLWPQLLPSLTNLTSAKRNNWIRPSSLRKTASRRQHHRAATFLCVPTSPMPCIHRCTSPAPF
jgi:protein-cysteine N-palmitoyltransferase HHAT